MPNTVQEFHFWNGSGNPDEQHIIWHICVLDLWLLTPNTANIPLFPDPSEVEVLVLCNFSRLLLPYTDSFPSPFCYNMHWMCIFYIFSTTINNSHEARTIHIIFSRPSTEFPDFSWLSTSVRTLLKVIVAVCSPETLTVPCDLICHSGDWLWWSSNVL